MKLILMIAPLLAITAAYTDLNDDYIPKLFEDEELFSNYLGCLVGLNECDEFGSHDKAHLSEELSDGCSKCDEIQKHYAHAVIQKAKTKYPELYKLFEEKYDKDGSLLEKLDQNVKNYW